MLDVRITMVPRCIYPSLTWELLSFKTWSASTHSRGPRYGSWVSNAEGFSSSCIPRDTYVVVSCWCVAHIRDVTEFEFKFKCCRHPTVSVSAESFSHGTGTLRCLQKEMATYRHWSVSLWRDSDDVPYCRILSPDKTEWRLISATLCGWRRCFMADQLRFMTCIREEEYWNLSEQSDVLRQFLVRFEFGFAFRNSKLFWVPRLQKSRKW